MNSTAHQNGGRFNLYCRGDSGIARLCRYPLCKNRRTSPRSPLSLRGADRRRGNLLAECCGHRDLKASTAPLLPPSFTRGDGRRPGGSMRYNIPSIAPPRRIRTAACSPRPSGTPLINAGGRGMMLIFGTFVIGSAYQEIPTACGLGMIGAIQESPLRR